MPTTIRQARIQQAARIITDHRADRSDPDAPRPTCHQCGREWSPRHVAEMLDEVGALGPRVTDE